MKRISVAVITAFAFFACKKDSVTKSQFTGVWEYEQYSGYPFTNTSLPPGNGKIIVLFANGNFERRENSTILFKGKYFLKKQKDCYGEDKKTHFTTNDTAFYWDEYIAINPESGKLELTTPNCYMDGGITYYRRIE